MRTRLSFIALLTLFACLVICVGLIAKRKWYDPFKKSARADRQVMEMARDHVLRDGDLIFQTSLSAQSQAIQAATHSVYSHCGIIYFENDKYYVYEAIKTVQLTPLEKWIARGQGGHFVVRRLKDAGNILAPAALAKLHAVRGSFSGKTL